MDRQMDMWNHNTLPPSYGGVLKGVLDLSKPKDKHCSDKIQKPKG